MRAYHENQTNTADCTPPTSYEIPASMPNLAALLEFARDVECGPVLDGGYEGYERRRVELLARVATELDAVELQKYDIDADRVTFEGRVYARCTKDVPKTYMGSAGSVTVRRNLFREWVPP